MNYTENKKNSNTGPNADPVSRYLDEGNPNTDKVIEKVQGEPSSDAKLVAATKEAIAKDRSLPADSKDVQVTADGGVITLIGKVVSQQEKMTIGDKAAAVAGFGNVNNQLQITEANDV